MGYYTAYTLEVIDGDPGIIEHLRATNEDAGSSLDTDGHNRWEMKWYRHEEDLAEFSKLYPTTVFKLSGDGEDALDFWCKYFKNGLMQYAKVKLVFDDFDESKLEPINETLYPNPGTSTPQ